MYLEPELTMDADRVIASYVTHNALYNEIEDICKYICYRQLFRTSGLIRHKKDDKVFMYKIGWKLRNAIESHLPESLLSSSRFRNLPSAP